MHTREAAEKEATARVFCVSMAGRVRSRWADEQCAVLLLK